MNQNKNVKILIFIIACVFFEDEQHEPQELVLQKI